MKPLFTLFALLVFVCTANAQKWVDKQYNIQTDTGLVFGAATDFAGRNITLKLDVALPTNDVAPANGRPLLVLMFGGAFQAGNRKVSTIANMMKDFAQRGYVAVAIDYRLGLYHANVEIGSIIPTRQCANGADTIEWYRAVYRSMQDVRGAIRYMVNKKAQYNIDPSRVYLAGESAGGFAALAAAFLDVPEEKPAEVGAVQAAAKPINFYLGCVSQLGITNYDNTDLKRPDLGDISGPSNPISTPYTVRAVGSLYGAMLPGWLEKHADPDRIPGIYLFHQPNDLIVPYGTNKAFKGISDCGVLLGNFPIINNPYVSGGLGIKQKIDALAAQGKKVPRYRFETTANNSDCIGQALNPATAGHALDNYDLRTKQMAEFFAETILDAHAATALEGVSVYPNPVQSVLHLSFDRPINVTQIELLDLLGRPVLRQNKIGEIAYYTLNLDKNCPAGVYVLNLQSTEGSYRGRVVVE